MANQKQPACCRRRNVRGHEQLVIETLGGQRITLKDAAGAVLIEDTSGNSIRMENGKVTVSTPGKLVLRASIVEINGSQVLVNAGMVQCSGVLKADTVVANSVAARELYAGRRKCVVTGTGEAGNVDW